MPAGQDWSTALAIAETRSAARTVCTLLPLLPAAVLLAVVVEWNVGNGVSITLTGVAGSIGLLGPVALLAEYGRRRRGLLTRPWRRCPADVAVIDRRPDLERMIVLGDDGPIVVRGAMSEAAPIVSARRELFLLGPDADGHVLIRVAGLCTAFGARLDSAPARPSDPVAAPACPPPGDRVMRSLRRGARCRAYPILVGALGIVVAALGVRPLSPAAFVVGGVLVALAAAALPVATALSRHYAAALAGARAATGWTALPATLFPWEPTDVVAGLVTLPTGTALIQFPLPDLDVVANIADTGSLWIRGVTPTGSGAIAVGVPGVPRLTFGVLQHDRDTPPDRPLPWLLRACRPSPDLSGARR